MQKLEVLIEENAFGGVRPVEVVADVPVAVLVPALVEELHLPQTDLFGKKLVYALRRGPGGLILPEYTTLASCGVEPGSRLALISYVMDGPAGTTMQGAAQQQPSSSSFHSAVTMDGFNRIDWPHTSAPLPTVKPAIKKEANWTRRAFLAVGSTALGVGSIGLGYAAYRSLFMNMAPKQPVIPHILVPAPVHPALPTKAKLVFSFTGHQQTVRVVAWSPDGTALASGADDTQLLVWSTGGIVRQTLRHPAPVRALAWSPDSQRLVTGSANQVLFLNAQTGATLARSTHRHFAPVTSLAWTAHGLQQVVSGALDMHAIVWDTNNYHAQTIFTRHTTPIEAVSWAAGGQIVASSSHGGAVRVWMAANGQEVHSYYLDAQIPMRGLAFAAAGSQLAVGGDDGIVRLWNGLNCQQQGTKIGTIVCVDMPMRLRAANKPIRTLAWSPDARFLAVGGDDGRVTVWYPAQGGKLLLAIQHNDAVHGLAWSPNGDQLVTASGNSAMVWALM